MDSNHLAKSAGTVIFSKLKDSVAVMQMKTGCATFNDIID